jgi:hypothetical protein
VGRAERLIARLRCSNWLVVLFWQRRLAKVREQLIQPLQ